MSIVIALDTGTQSSRAIAFDATGEQLSTGRARHPELTVGDNGAVTQSPTDVWNALSQAISDCVATLGPRRDEIVAAALTTQRFTMIPCTADGTPLMDAIHWLDRRQGKLDDSALPKLLNRVPKMRTILGASRGRVLHTVAPELIQGTERFLPLSAWLTLQLTGEAVDTPGSFPGIWPMNAKTGEWQSHDRMAKLLQIPISWLPPLVPAGAALGTISANGATATGLPRDLPLVAVGGDKQAEILGSGGVSTNASVGAISLGTAASVTTLIRRFQQDLSAQIYTTAAAEPNAWCLEYMLNRGMWMVTWFMKNVAPDLDISEMEALAKDTPIGAQGLSCIPRWAAPVAAPHERGAFLGFTEATGRAHMYRALIEGIGMDLRWGLDLLESKAKRQLTDLRVGGGGSQSEWVVQTLANVLGRPLRRGRTQELSALGAAINAAVHSGLYPDTESAVQVMTAGGSTVAPDAAAAEIYRGLYADRYLPRFQGLGRLFRR
jgi:sugar (pentulose or hexulose) kinase